MAGSHSDALADVRAATAEARRVAIKQALAVRYCRALGVSWRELGKLFGVSQQAAHNRWAGYCTDLETQGLRLPKPAKGDRWLSEAQASTLLGLDLTTFRVMQDAPSSTPRKGVRYYRESDVFAWAEYTYSTTEASK
jgi:hypothetical protein